MHYNIGEYIKKVSQYVTIVGMISAIFTGYIDFKQNQYVFDSEFAVTMHYIVHIAVVSFVAWIISLMFYGIGEIIELLGELNNTIKSKSEMLYRITESEKKDVKEYSDGKWKCVNIHCGHINDSKALFCKKCGTSK